MRVSPAPLLAQLVTLERVHVEQIEMPPFLFAPTVVLWGARTFVRDDASPMESLVYVEVFAWTAPVMAPAPSETG